MEQESSAKLTNQRVSYAFTARLVSMPVIVSLHPSSSIVILVFYLFSEPEEEPPVPPGRGGASRMSGASC